MAIAESHDLMHRRVRNQYLNNSLFKRATHVLRDLIVGKGIHAFSDPIDYTFGLKLDDRPESDLLRALDYGLETDEKFLAWAEDKNQVDVAGRYDHFSMQRQVIQEIILVGSIITVECFRPGQPVPLCYKLIEREQICTELDRDGRLDSDGRWQNRISQGFELDRQNREVAVYLYADHPHDEVSIATPRDGITRLEAGRYRHHFLPARPSQTVGATMLATIGQPAWDRDKFTETELRSAVKAAQHLLVAKLNNPFAGSLGFEDFEDDPDPLNRPQLSLGSDPVAAEIQKDEELELIEPTRPTDRAGPFFDILDHDIAAGTDTSFYSLTGRFDKTNYGGFRGAMNWESAQMQPLQEWLGRDMILPTRRRWNELAVALGHIDRISSREFLRERSRYQRFDVIGPTRNLLDPDKETEGDISELRGLMSTLKIKCAQRNLHWLKVLRQRHLEERIASELGIVLDFSKGQGGQVERSTSSAGAGNDDDDYEETE